MAGTLARFQVMGKTPTKKTEVLQKQLLITKLATYAQYQDSLQNLAKSKATVSMEDFC